MRLLEPQLRRTSEVRYHSDRAPGRRFVFVGRVIAPICQAYIVGREVDAVPADQPEWLDDHRHNCPTFYVLIGRNSDLSGLEGEIVIEGQHFTAEAPCAIMLPPAYLHHHRLTVGSGWSLHINVRPDYEESLLDLPADTPRRHVDLWRVYRRAEATSRAAYDSEVRSGAMPQQRSLGYDGLWNFIDPEEFDSPGVRLHAVKLAAHGPSWREQPHQHDQDEVSILLPCASTPLTFEMTSGAESMAARSPCAVYVPEHVPHRGRYVSGEGIVLKFLRLPWKP